MSRRNEIAARQCAVAVCVAVLGLAGCASQALIPPKEVDIPVPVYCGADYPAIPVLPLTQIPTTATDAAVARAYADTVTILESDDLQLRNSLKACLKPAAVNTPGSLKP